MSTNALTIYLKIFGCVCVVYRTKNRKSYRYLCFLSVDSLLTRFMIFCPPEIFW